MMKFDIPGPPVGKERPRFRLNQGRVRTFTPEKTASWAEEVQAHAIQAGVRQHYTEHPVAVHILIERAVPKSWSKKRKQAALLSLYADAKPDVDNVSKAILDALNHVAWKDDSQVARLSVERIYSERDNTTVEIKKLKKEIG